MSSCETNDCLPEPDCSGYPFERVTVLPTVNQGARVEWKLDSRFAGERPYRMSLESAPHGIQDATDWVTEGSVVSDPMYLRSSYRPYNAHHRGHYRIRLVTADNQVYLSKPVLHFGFLSRDNWLRAKEQLRQADVQLRVNGTGIPYVVLKRKIQGQPCPKCRDVQTGETIRRENCLICYGTGFQGGYWVAPNCSWAQTLTLPSRFENTDGIKGTTINGSNIVTPVKTPAIPMLDTYDVMVNLRDDTRHFVHVVTPAVQLDACPIIYNVTLHQAPFTHSIYKFPVPRQDELLDG